MDLLLIRHGESLANTGRIFSNTGWKHGLTEKGMQQAHAAAKAVVPFFGLPQRVYSSPIKRAFETAAVISEAIAAEHRVLSELSEISVGELEGRADLESWKIHNAVWDRWFRMGDLNARIPGGESLRDATDRFKALLSRLDEEEGEGSRLVLVSHGGFMLSALLNLVYDVPEFIPRRGFIAHCELIRVQIGRDHLRFMGIKSPHVV